MDVPFPHVAACVDDSEASLVALAEAVRIRDETGCRLSVVHVATAPPLVGYSRWGPENQGFYQAAEEWLDGLVAGTPGAEAVLLWGHPASTACDWAAQAGADLLVVAAHSGRLHRTVLGSFAGHVAHHAPCSVLVMPPPTASALAAPAEPEGRQRSIAAAVDEEGVLFADGAAPTSLADGWSAGHLALAALAREAVEGVGRAATDRGHRARGRATASATLPAGDGVLRDIRIGVNVEIDPAPERAALDAMLGAARQGAAVAGALEVPPVVSWHVNGVLVRAPAPPGCGVSRNTSP